MGKSLSYKKIKVGQVPGDLSPEMYRDHPASKSIIRRKSRRQFQERTRLEVKEALQELEEAEWSD